MKKLVLGGMFLFLPFSLYAANDSTKKLRKRPYEKTFLIDRHGSMYTGASLLLSTESFLIEIRDYLLPAKKPNFWANFGAGLVDCYLTIQLTSLYYEMFGYGFRVRSLGGTVQKYQWGWLGFEAISSKFYPHAAYDIPLLIDAAGYEASQVLMQEIVLSSLKNSPLNSNANLIYTLSYLSKLAFILNGNGVLIGIFGGDNRSLDSKQDYLGHINAKHQGAADKIKLSDLQLPGLILIPDVLIGIMAYYSLDQEARKQPGTSFFQWKDIAYRPFLTAQFTPFGIAYSMHNYLRHQERIFLLSFNLGKSPFYTSYYGGLGGKTDGLWKYKNYALDLAAHLWYQPKLLLQATDVSEDKNYGGGLVGIYNKFKINPHFSLYGAMLYKTAGYLEGMVAQKGFIWQAGITVSYAMDVEHFYME